MIVKPAQSIPVGLFSSGGAGSRSRGHNARSAPDPDPSDNRWTSILAPPGPWLPSGHYARRAAPIVQRSRTPAFQAGNTGSNPVGGTRGRGEAWSSRRPVKPEIAGSNPVVPARVSTRAPGQVAQLEERRSEKPEAGGSIPPLTTLIPPASQGESKFRIQSAPCQF